MRLTTEDDKQASKDMTISARRGRSKKRSRSKTLLTNAFAIIQEQQQASDNGFF